MKYVEPKAELLLLSTDPIMDSFEADNLLNFWDILNGSRDSFKTTDVLDIWDLLNA